MNPGDGFVGRARVERSYHADHGREHHLVAVLHPAAPSCARAAAWNATAPPLTLACTFAPAKLGDEARQGARGESLLWRRTGPAWRRTRACAGAGAEGTPCVSSPVSQVAIVCPRPLVGSGFRKSVAIAPCWAEKPNPLTSLGYRSSGLPFGALQTRRSGSGPLYSNAH